MSASSVARRAVKVLAAGADQLHRPPRGIVVLIYHRVGERTSMEVDLPVALFDEQMAYLRSRGPVVTLDEALDLVAGPAADAPDPVVVTFDDGTADFVDVALPVLERHRVPATLYVASAFIDEGRSFPDGGRPVSWAGLRDACTTGLVGVESHTHTHALLDRLPAGEVGDELDRSIALIADELGQEASHFAYPKALAGSTAAEREVVARFRSAALAGTRPNRYQATDPHRLARTPVQRSDGFRWFERKVEGGMGAEDRLRRVVNRRRYADAVV